MIINNSYIDSLSISSWNVNGLGQKHRDEEFIEKIKYDINILIETWKGDCSDIKIPNYNSFCKYRIRKKRARRNSGGIIVYVKKDIVKGIEYMKNISRSRNRLWLKLDKSFFGIDEDIYLCGIYVPPINSPHYDNEYQNLESEINSLTNKGRILLMGDFNSRTATGADFILHDECNDRILDILPDNYKSDFYLARKSQDKILNSQGKELLNLCASAQLRLLNGRYVGDILGNMTCFNKMGCSIVDYAVTSVSLLSSVKYFIVKNPTHYSDHNQLVTHLKCSIATPSLHKDYAKQEFSFKWTKLSKKLLENELLEKHTCENVVNFETKRFQNSAVGVNMANEMISSIYIELSKKCMRKSYHRKKKKKNKSPWTDSEFLSLRTTVSSLGKKVRLFPFDQTVKLKFLFFSKKLKTASKFKRKQYKKNILDKISNLSPTESKEFWNILKSIDNKNQRSDENYITDLNLLANHFRTQGQPEKIDPIFEKQTTSELLNREQNLTEKCTDNPISISEIKTVIRKLKNGKSCGPDLIRYEIIIAQITSYFFNLI